MGEGITRGWRVWGGGEMPRMNRILLIKVLQCVSLMGNACNKYHSPSSLTLSSYYPPCYLSRRTWAGPGSSCLSLRPSDCPPWPTASSRDCSLHPITFIL